MPTHSSFNLVVRRACATAIPAVFLLVTLRSACPQGSKTDYERALSLDNRTANRVYRDHVKAHWLPGGARFGYRVETGPKQREWVLVDAEKGTREVASEAAVRALEKEEPLPSQVALPRRSDHTGEATSITFCNRSAAEVEVYWLTPDGHRRSYGKLAPGGRLHIGTYEGHVWLVVDAKAREVALVEARGEPGRVEVDGTPLPPRPAGAAPRGASPDGKWVALLKNHNVWLRHSASGREFALSTDGTADDAYVDGFHWSPDSKRMVVIQVAKGQEHKVYFVESSPRDQLQPKLHALDYLKPGDRIDHPRPRLFDVARRRRVPVQEDLFPNPWAIGDLRWSLDGSRFMFLYNQRGHQVLRVLAVEATTGVVRPLVEETSPTFIDYSQKTYLEWLDPTDELIWMSERDGWNHLWLYDTRRGAVKNQITRGPWVVRRVERVDADRRQIWFFAGGVRPSQDPYYLHLCRVNFDGTGFAVLTEGDGTHQVEFSPNRRWFLDTWSRVDQPPITELRRADDGRRVCLLERADASTLLATGWSPPERFCAKGRDGSTDVYGILIRPANFDSAKKYPVVEQVYAGPHGAFVPKAWDRQIGLRKMAELGFIVVQIDGMGTNWRSRAFHDVCWKNLKDGGFPDRIAWLRAAAATRPWMDLQRVGIYGGSTGGMNALGALLHYGDFYKVGVADCGCHDNRMDKIWWNEAWMGWPVGAEYADNSNVTHARNLRGKLLLIVGEVDANVDPASTMQVVDALEKADKDFELLVMTGTGHGAAETTYGSRRRMDFFVRHLLGKEPRWTE
jgi:dipeptidyl aminopeptidase/acylaminoacyl peptidase